MRGAVSLPRQRSHIAQAAAPTSVSPQSQQVNIIPLGWRHLPQLRQPGLCCHAWSFGHTKKASSVSSTAPLTARTAAAAAWESSSSSSWIAAHVSLQIISCSNTWRKSRCS